MENQIDSFSELDGYLNELSNLASSIESTMTQLQTTFSNQQEGWASSNSQREADKMSGYVQEAKKLSTNIETIKTSVANFKRATQEEDAI